MKKTIMKAPSYMQDSLGPESKSPVKKAARFVEENKNDVF
jgi:hypothetical protein